MGISSSKPIENKKIDQPTVAAIEQTKEKTPYQKYLDEQFQKWTDWDNQTGPKDITTAPGMSNYLDIYGNAGEAAAKERVGDPTHAFTANLPGFNNQLQTQKKMDIYNTRAKGLHDAFEGSRAQGLGEGGTAADLDINRRNQYAQDMMGYNESYYHRPLQQNPWMTAAQLAIGGLGAAGGIPGLKAI